MRTAGTSYGITAAFAAIGVARTGDTNKISPWGEGTFGGIVARLFEVGEGSKSSSDLVSQFAMMYVRLCQKMATTRPH